MGVHAGLSKQSLLCKRSPPADVLETAPLRNAGVVELPIAALGNPSAVELPIDAITTSTALMDAQEIYEDILQVSSGQAMASSLLLTFAYVISGDQVDLEPICSGWKGRRAENKDFQFDDLCQTCQNIWDTCVSNDAVVITIQVFNFFSSLFFLMNAIINVSLVQLFARLPRTGAKILYDELGQLLTKRLPNTMISMGVVTFAVAFFLQASLVLSPLTFAVFLGIGGFVVLVLLATVVYMVKRYHMVKEAVRKHVVQTESRY